MQVGIAKKMGEIVGGEHIHTDKLTRWIYAKDASPLPPAYPELVVTPGQEAEIAAILQCANENKIPVYTRSGGSNLWGGCIPEKGGLVLDLRRMNKILSIDPEQFSCTVQPAITFSRLQEELAAYQEGYYNLVTPEGADASCMGGSFAAHGDGIGSALWGTQGDAVIGCKVVLPSGEIVTTGSAANPAAAKVAGGSGQFFRYAYAHDLTGLFCGSEGTLGVVVEITTKIEKIPEKYGFRSYAFHRVEDACQVLYRARQERIPANFAALREKKSLQAVVPGDYPEAQLVYILEGSNEAVDCQLHRLDQIVREHQGLPGDNQSAERFWQKRYSLIPGSMYKLGSRSLLPLHYPLGKLDWYYGEIRKICAEIIEKRHRLAYFIGGFQIDTCFVCYPTIMFLEQYPQQYYAVLKCVRETQEALLNLGGAPIQIGRLWAGAVPKTGGYYSLLKTLKKAVDPNNIMNPGLLELT